jgi:hypothetical protein
MEPKTIGEGTTTKLVLSSHSDVHKRVAVVVPDDMYESIDVVDEKGNLLGRLNLFNPSNGHFSVDLMFNPSGMSTYGVRSWLCGKPDSRNPIIIESALVNVRHENLSRD